ncbi:MAG: flippase-like domain-containing protein [Thermoflexales bacterium]|nr:flippase-like domain-containing protein [Thermoflexales bacterium]
MTINHTLIHSRGARLAWLLLGLALSLLAAWLAVRDVHWGSVIEAIARANGWWLLAALLSVVLTTLLKALRWQALLVPRPREVSIWDLFAALVVGQMLNMALPMRAGDVGRAAFVGRPSLSRMQVLATVAAEKWLDMTAAFALAMGLLPFMVWPEWARSSLGTLGVAVLAGVVGLAIVTLFRRRLAALVERLESSPARSLPLVARAVEWLRRAWQGVAALRTPSLAAGVIGWTVLTWLLGASTNWLVGRALGLPGSAVMWSFVLLVLQVGVAVPSVPGRIGVFEYLTMLALALFGVQGEVALAYALVLHVLVIGPIVIGGLALWPLAARIRNVSLDAEG